MLLNKLDFVPRKQHLRFFLVSQLLQLHSQLSRHLLSRLQRSLQQLWLPQLLPLDSQPPPVVLVSLQLAHCRGRRLPQKKTDDQGSRRKLRKPYHRQVGFSMETKDRLRRRSHHPPRSRLVRILSLQCPSHLPPPSTLSPSPCTACFNPFDYMSLLHRFLLLHRRGTSTFPLS